MHAKCWQKWNLLVDIPLPSRHVSFLQMMPQTLLKLNASFGLVLLWSLGVRSMLQGTTPPLLAAWPPAMQRLLPAPPVGFLHRQPASAVGPSGDFSPHYTAGCGVWPRTAMLPLPNLPLPGLLPAQTSPKLGLRGSGEQSIAALGSAHPRSVLTARFFTPSRLRSSCRSVGLLCHEQRCQHPLHHCLRWGCSPHPGRKQDKVWGLGFFFLTSCGRQVLVRDN